jgi:hypothetical protein
MRDRIASITRDPLSKTISPIVSIPLINANSNMSKPNGAYKDCRSIAPKSTINNTTSQFVNTTNCSRLVGPRLVFLGAV